MIVKAEYSQQRILRAIYREETNESGDCVPNHDYPIAYCTVILKSVYAWPVDLGVLVNNLVHKPDNIQK